MLQSLWKSISTWGDLPANFPYTLGPTVPYPFELPGGFVQFAATSTKPAGGSATDDDGRKCPTLDALLNPSNGGQVSVFALKRDKQQPPPLPGIAGSQHSFEQAKNHLVKCKTLLHPNLLKVLGTFETSSALYVVTECCFSLPHVLYLSQQQQQNQSLAAKRPAALPRQKGDDAPNAAVAALPDTACYAAAAAAAAAATADTSCWNFLELIGGLSFLHDQCKLAHGEVSPFSVFVTPHGKWKLSCFMLSRPLESVHWPNFYSEIQASTSCVQGWQPPRPSQGARPDAVDRWGLCSIFAWWRDSRRDPYSAARFARGGVSGDAPNGFSVGIDDASVRQALHRLPYPLQRLMQQILDPNPTSITLSKLADGGDSCFSADSFQLRQHGQVAVSDCEYASILKCILSIVASISKPSDHSHDNSSNIKDYGTTMPLRILSEVLVHAFDSADRAIRFTLLSQLPEVQHLLPGNFFAQTWAPLILGLEDSAPPIRAATARALALYASRLPLDAPPASSVFALLEQRLRDVAGGVRLEAVAAAAAAARDCSARGPRQCPQLLTDILATSLKDSEESVRLAGLEASVYCADLLPLPGLVSLLIAASSCLLSASPAVVVGAPDCIHALTDAAKARVGEQQQQQRQTEDKEEEISFPAKGDGRVSQGWITTVKSLGAALGLSKRGSGPTGFLARNTSSSCSSADLRSSGVPRPPPSGSVPPPSHPPEPSQPHSAPNNCSALTRSADEFKDAHEPVGLWADDSEIPADAWEATSEFDAVLPGPDGGRKDTPGVAARRHNNSGNICASQRNQAGPGQNRVRVSSPVTSVMARANAESPHQPAGPRQYSPATSFASGGSTSMRLQVSDSSTLSAIPVTSVMAPSTSLKGTARLCSQAAITKVPDGSSTDDFFAALEREAAERNL